MAKGRKLTTSRSELYLGIYGYNHGQESVNGSPELREDEVWSMVDDSGDDHSANGEWSSRASTKSNGSYSNYRNRRPPSQTDHRQVGGLSLAFDGSSNTSSSPRVVDQYCAQDTVTESSRGRNMATSAPVNVPDWSKIYRVDSVESMYEDTDESFNYESEMVPPHEYLAREYARRGKTAANSVFEGMGRTLKGRDLSRVRDAVWSQTGFDG